MKRALHHIVRPARNTARAHWRLRFRLVPYSLSLPALQVGNAEPIQTIMTGRDSGAAFP
ncbi:MAG TPA: hypothetical protein VIW01_07090 [Dehalococcoidia bacterium]